jgi:hypothetical protein
MYYHRVRSHPTFSPFIRLLAAGLMLLLIISLSLQLHPSDSIPLPLQGLTAPRFDHSSFQIVANQGDHNAPMRFQAQGLGGSVAFTQQGIRLHLPMETAGDGPSAEWGSEVLRLHFVDANPAPLIKASAPLPGHVNKIQGRDPVRWYTHLPAYRQIEYKELYPRIQLRYEGMEGRLKGTFKVACDADPRVSAGATMGQKR